MAMRIEDYAIIADTHTAALVGRDGCIDWACLPRFDSPACFARLLGDDRHGYWRIAPAGEVTGCRRRYRDGTMVLETELDTAEGTIRLVDCMPVRERYPEVVRLVQGVKGRVPVRMELVVRFGNGSVTPWVRRDDGMLSMVAGPDALCLWSSVETRGEDFTTVAELTVAEDQAVPFVLAWHPSHLPSPRPVDARFAVEDTERWWREWSEACTYEGEWGEAVTRSVLTLKALTYAPTGGIVAAATTSLPETLGGSRNWDYRYCWLRDATFTLQALMVAGYHGEAAAWRDWLLRAVAGDPRQLQIMYGPAGERRLDERELDWLPGYEGSRPVRIGNAAAGQYQLDVYGEVMDALHQARVVGIDPSASGWGLQQALIEFLEDGWKEPDDGIWEVRGPRRHFTHSKVMAWVALDRAVKSVEELGLEGPVDRWKAVRQDIHDEICTKGWNADQGSFTQYYGSDLLDASLLMIPLVGFLPADDPRVVGTVDAIRDRLTEDGFVLRYRAAAAHDVDGLAGREGAFLACSFWLADALAVTGRREQARALFERLLALRNDVGLLAEEWDPVAGRQVGNFPQAFSHVALVNTASNLGHVVGSADVRRGHAAPAERANLGG
ncbi:MAG: glycoside hydrolase family 15 protein, partial [Acidimicrobiales bacterium]